MLFTAFAVWVIFFRYAYIMTAVKIYFGVGVVFGFVVHCFTLLLLGY